ncbi:MAG: hypothetical protein EYX74_06815 [Desulfobulbaceae bacterium]|nr:MAG: hypothetical protein EYX74_06815 [Desulfobulbaceae bacterium]
MKISDVSQSPLIAGRNQSSDSSPAGGTNFAAILQSHLRGATATNSATAVNAATIPNVTTSAHLRLESLGITQTTIATLDSFSAALGNTALKVEELEPYISALENNVVAMLSLKERLPSQDPLSKILEEVASVSYLATAKYHRGDYNI